MKISGIKGFVAGFIAATVVFTSCMVFADMGDLSISAMLMNSYKMKLNGADYVPKDTDGSTIAPISFHGHTYLPVRSLAEALNTPVDWDGPTKTVWIGGKRETVPVKEVSQYQDYYGTIITTDVAKLSTPDKAYSWGIVNGTPLELAIYGCYLSPMQKYKTLQASVYLDSGVKQDLVFEVRKDKYDGPVLQSLTLKPGSTTQLNVDITGVDKVCLIADIKIGHDKVSQLVIGEPVFKNEPAERNTDVVK